jgi:hypothetical protein
LPVGPHHEANVAIGAARASPYLAFGLALVVPATVVEWNEDMAVRMSSSRAMPRTLWSATRTADTYRIVQRLIELDHVPPAATQDRSVVNREPSIVGLADGLVDGVGPG